MADPQSTGPPGGPAVSLWPPRPPPPYLGHQQNLITPLPPPFPPGHPAFAHGFHSHPPQEHYYSAGPRPFPLHGHPPNQGSSFGPSLLPPPPPRAPPQELSAALPSIQSPSGGAGHATAARPARHINTFPPARGIAKSCSLGFRKEQNEDTGVMENVVLQLEKEIKVDVGELLSQIRALVSQADEVVQKFGKLAKLEPSMAEPRFVTCPYDPTHRVCPNALFKHFLCCPSNPKPQVVDPEKLISSLQYPKWRHRDEEDSEIEIEYFKTLELEDGGKPNSSISRLDNVTEGGILVEKRNVTENLVSAATEEAAKESVSKEIDIWGGKFFYKDSPAVVQAPLHTPYPAPEPSVSQLALVHPVNEVGVKLESMNNSTDSLSSTGRIGNLLNGETCGGRGVGRPLLSSRLWWLQREIETWKELPTRLSTLVLQAATGLGRIRKRVVSQWVLLQGSAHGVVIDPAMASHIHSLARICFRSIQKEASHLTDSQHDCPPRLDEDTSHGPKSSLLAKGGTDDQERLHGNDKVCLTKVKEEPTSVVEVGVGLRSKVSLVDFPHLFQSGQWLASQLSSLFDPVQSKALVLKLVKHCLVSSGRTLASSFVAPFTKQHAATTLGCLQLDVKPPDELQTPEDMPQIDSKHLKSKDDCVDRSSLPLEMETAVAAVRERAILESYLRSLSHPSSALKFQMIQEHEATVTMAAAERHKRVNYRPVLEHDGLIWHRSQLEEKNKNKTREDILAEERDYKRRRMSYRGKRLKRNPTQVLHDLIGGHMEEIVEAGGIGCAVKHTGGVLLSSGDGRFDNSQPGRQDDRSNERIRSRTFQQDVNYSESQGDKFSGRGDGSACDDGKYRSDSSSRKFYRQNSPYNSVMGQDDHSFYSRSGKGHGSVSRIDWTDNVKKDEWRNQRHSQRYSGSREGSHKDDDYERRHNREDRGKPKSSY